MITDFEVSGFGSSSLFNTAFGDLVESLFICKYTLFMG